jgi:DNA-binding XRE family transcriptional regulator
LFFYIVWLHRKKVKKKTKKLRLNPLTKQKSYCNIALRLNRIHKYNEIGDDEMAIEKVTLPVARKIAGLTQKGLASAVEVSESTVINWEKGRSEPTVGQAQKISEVTGIPLDSIIFLPSNTVKP